MGGEKPELIALCVITMAALVIFQAVFSLIFSLVFSRKLKKLRQRLPLIARRTEEALKLGSGLLLHLQSVAKGVMVVQERLSVELGQIDSGIKSVDQATQRTLTVLRDSLRPISGHLDRALSQLSRQTFRVHRAILKPALEASAVMRGVLSVLTQFGSSPDRDCSVSATSDEEIFI